MKHVIFGGNGFTGRYLADALLELGQSVLICDLSVGKTGGNPIPEFVYCDILDRNSLEAVPLEENDIVYHLAARQYHLAVPKRSREAFFDDVNVGGTENILALMESRNCSKMIYFSSDMVYGYPERIPVSTDHPCRPLGPYGASKLKSEVVCREYREKGMNITIFRPRLIIGPGRLGVLEKLFRLIEKNWPVPLIGDGSNFYQMISVFDCVSAILDAVKHDVPNSEFNLGSDSPPCVSQLLNELIQEVGSNSKLVKTPGSLVKFALSCLDRIGLTLLYKEQFAIADVNYLVDISRTQNVLGWTPQYRDADMIRQAFEEYRRT